MSSPAFRPPQNLEPWQTRGEVRIHELTIATGNRAGESKFWGETLGLRVRDGGDGALEVSLQASILRFEQASPGTDPFLA